MSWTDTPHGIAVVFAANKVYLVQLHCDISVGVKTSAHVCLRCWQKKTREEASTGQCRGPELIRKDGGTNSGGTSTTWTGSRPDARQRDGSRSHPAIGTLSSEVRSAILNHGPCRLKVPFAISSENDPSKLLVVGRSIGNTKRVGQLRVRQTEELRSEYQIDIAWCVRPYVSEYGQI